MIIPFGEYLPDQPDLSNPGVLRAENVLPAAIGYRPLPSLAVYSAALGAKCIGAISGKSSAGVTYNYAGTGTKLYVLADTAWTDVTALSGDYTTTAGEHWEFVRFKEKILAVNWDASFTDNPQAITLGGANFADLTSTVQGRHIAVVGDFVVLGNVYDVGGTTAYPLGVWNCAIGDETNWTVSASTLANFTNLRNGTQIRRITSGSVGLVLCESTIYRMAPLGGGAVPFAFDEVDPGVGIHASGGVVSAGRNVFFLADDGFRVSVDHGPSVRIGSERVNRAMLSEIDAANLPSVTATQDPRSNVIYWAIPTGGSTGGVADKLYIFNPDANRWSTADIDVELLYQSGTSGYTLEGLDSISSSLDALPESLDSPVWAGGNIQLAAFDINHKLGYFTGSPMTGAIETQEMQLTAGRRTMVRSLRPLVDHGAVTVSIGTRDIETDDVTYSPSRAVRSSGRLTTRASGRYHRFLLSLTGSYTEALGIADIEATPAGTR